MIASLQTAYNAEYALLLKNEAPRQKRPPFYTKSAQALVEVVIAYAEG